MASVGVGMLSNHGAEGLLFIRSHPTPYQCLLAHHVYYRTNTVIYFPVAKGAGMMGVNCTRSVANFRT